MKIELDGVVNQKRLIRICCVRLIKIKPGDDPEAAHMVGGRAGTDSGIPGESTNSAFAMLRSVYPDSAGRGGLRCSPPFNWSMDYNEKGKSRKRNAARLACARRRPSGIAGDQPPRPLRWLTSAREAGGSPRFRLLEPGGSRCVYCIVLHRTTSRRPNRPICHNRQSRHRASDASTSPSRRSTSSVESLLSPRDRSRTVASTSACSVATLRPAGTSRRASYRTSRALAGPRLPVVLCRRPGRGQVIDPACGPGIFFIDGGTGIGLPTLPRQSVYTPRRRVGGPG
jgi:hypothetical protein